MEKNKKQNVFKRLSLSVTSTLLALSSGIVGTLGTTNLASAQTISCRNYVYQGKTLTWSTRENGVFHNSGTLKITKIRSDGTWSGYQVNGTHEEDVLGEVSGGSFVLRVPRWNETWVGVCGSDSVAGVIQRTSDGNDFTFLIR
ncbi:hemolysin-type calcium-binding region [[Leptolyngbya] sp. PCC 7376]|uniref:hypothetical protein n=1 Tax=[Leptolyngbya] sp. PCC 7376 TaxID=111781 RepID=UPI00029EE1EA|nr:hypothetical protein [[Leptolyngbya] sp. PCC 7376]AFY39549.1 hemolysin-type calcium-binding region [[Leptolyngbya] sp. PCC 7376]